MRLNDSDVYNMYVDLHLRNEEFRRKRECTILPILPILYCRLSDFSVLDQQVEYITAVTCYSDVTRTIPHNQTPGKQEIDFLFLLYSIILTFIQKS